MNARVVDVNVAIVANDFAKMAGKVAPLAPQADDRCRLKSLQALRKIKQTGIVLIDDAGEVVSGYRVRLSFRGQPGSGDAFYKHVVENSSNYKKVRKIRLSKTPRGEFKDFPADPDLRTFDYSDRIYVALVKAAPIKSTIVNSLDSDYEEHAAALRRNAVHVEELCLDCLKTRI